MIKQYYDMEDGDISFESSEAIGMDLSCDMMMVDDNIGMDLQSSDIRQTTTWNEGIDDMTEKW